VRQQSTNEIPPGMKVQLARLFGSGSAAAKMKSRSVQQWKRTLLNILAELDRYLAANVETDDVHLLMLHSGLYAAHESLKDENFWPGYVEGITRFALLLMGDYPDHRRRKGGRKHDNHYHLGRLRSVRYIQNARQKLSTLAAAPQVGIALSMPPYEALMEFRRQYGSRPGYDKFFKWYRQSFPRDYAAVF
jgi:hypothetical protein